MGIAAGIGVGLIAGVVLKYIYDSYIQERPLRKELKYIVRKAFKRNKKCLIMWTKVEFERKILVPRKFSYWSQKDSLTSMKHLSLYSLKQRNLIPFKLENTKEIISKFIVQLP